jgi:hypothetical protein
MHNSSVSGQTPCLPPQKVANSTCGKRGQTHHQVHAAWHSCYGGGAAAGKEISKKGAPYSLKGGAYAFHGSFGCAFSPPLAHEDPEPCPDCGRAQQVLHSAQLLPAERRLGKVMRYDEAWAEYRQARRLARLDPEGRFGLYPDPPVRVIPASAAQSAGGAGQLSQGKDLEAVRRLLEDDLDAPLEAQPYQLVMERALGDMVTAMRACRGAAPLLTRVHAHMHALRNLYAGLQHMHAAGICHLDVKPENCVAVGGTLDMPGAYKFIDFGLTQSFAELAAATPSTRQLLLSRQYSAYPFQAYAWWRTFPSEEPGGSTVTEFEDDPYQLVKESEVQASRHADTLDRIQKYQAGVKREFWDPLFRLYTPEALRLEAQGMLRLYSSARTGGFDDRGRHHEKEEQALQAHQVQLQEQEQPFAVGAEARVIAARAADVFGLGRVTALVYACVANVTFKHSPGHVRENAAWGDDPMGLRGVHGKLSALIYDMMRMRVKDDEILARFDLFLSSIPEA